MHPKFLRPQGTSHGYREGLGATIPWHVSRAPRGTPPLGAEGGWELGELEARVHADGVAQLLPQDALLAVVGQLEQVEAGGGGGQAATWLPLADGKEATQDAAQGVAGVLQAHPTASGWGVPGERAGPAPCGGQPAWRGGLHRSKPGSWGPARQKPA